MLLDHALTDHIQRALIGVFGDAQLTVRGDSTFAADQLFLGDTINLEAGGKLDVAQDSELLNNAYVRVMGNGSEWTQTGTMALGSTGDADFEIVDGGALTAQEQITFGVGAGHEGRLSIDDGASRLNAMGGLLLGDSGAGVLNIAGGTTVVKNSFRLGEQVSGHGEVNLSGGTLRLDGVMMFRGSGTAAFNFTGGRLELVEPASDLILTGVNLNHPVHQTGGVLAPEGSAVLGNYTFGDQATLEIDLSKSADNTITHDEIITALTTLGGTLDLRLAGEQWVLGDQAAIIRAFFDVSANLNGTFDRVTGMQVDDETLLAVTYTDTQVLVTAATPGDTNLDGTVNALDLQALADAFDTSGTWADGDFNGDGDITLDDLTILGTFWNTGVAQADAISFEAALQTVSFTVPEPGALALLAMAGVVAARRRRQGSTTERFWS